MVHLFFSHFVESTNHAVWGISRKGKYFEEFYDEDNKLPLKNLVFSLGDYFSDKTELSINEFVKSIDCSSVTFIHTMGKFVTEIDENGELLVEDDHDGDGINDDVKRLSYHIPSWFLDAFAKQKKTLNFIQIGSLADKHSMELHGSWVKSLELLKEGLNKTTKEFDFINALILNVSSVLTPKELIERPYASVQTNADLQYWLPPIEIARFIADYISQPIQGFVEKDLFKIWPNFSKKHFGAEDYKERRKKELFNSSNEKYSSIVEMEDGDNISFNLHNTLHLDKLWGDLTLFLFDYHKQDNLKQAILFYNPRMWFFLLREHTEKNLFSKISEEGGLILLTCGNRSDIDENSLKKEFLNLNHKYVIGHSHGMPNNYNLNIYGDFIIEVQIDKNTAEQIEDFYKKNEKVDINSLKELQEFTSAGGNNTLTVYRDKKRAEELRSTLSSNFDIPTDYKL